MPLYATITFQRCRFSSTAASRWWIFVDVLKVEFHNLPWHRGKGVPSFTFNFHIMLLLFSAWQSSITFSLQIDCRPKSISFLPKWRFLVGLKGLKYWDKPMCLSIQIYRPPTNVNRWRLFYESSDKAAYPQVFLFDRWFSTSPFRIEQKMSLNGFLRLICCQWTFLVPLIGGRNHIITQLATYKWYLSGIYCQLGDYMVPTTY